MIPSLRKDRIFNVFLENDISRFQKNFSLASLQICFDLKYEQGQFFHNFLAKFNGICLYIIMPMQKAKLNNFHRFSPKENADFSISIWFPLFQMVR